MKKQETRSQESKHNNALIKRLSANLRQPWTKRSLEIARLKEMVRADDLFKIFPRLFQDAGMLETVYGPAFPSDLSSVFYKKPQYGPASPLNEVVWSICRCLQYGNELETFVESRLKFERAFLRDAKEECNTALRSVEQQFGCSIWLAENRLSTTHTWQGIDEARKLSRTYEEETETNLLVHLVLRFVSRRIEATGFKDHLKSELNRMFGQSNPVLENYLRAKLFDLPSITLTNDVPITLLFEGHASIIDLYETVVSVLQSAASSETVPDELLVVLEKPICALYKRTKDIRLVGVMRGLGFSDSASIVGNAARSKIIEEYSKANYGAVVADASDYLEHNPGDMSIFVLKLKANIDRGTVDGCDNGVLKLVSERLSQVFECGADTYSAAFNLLAVFERFYSHDWARYLRTSVLHELRTEEAIFPGPQLRELFVRDPYATPFTAVAANGRSKQALLRAPVLRGQYPYTWSVYDTVIAGVSDPTFPVGEARRHTYLARHHIAFGDPIMALSHYGWLMENTGGGQQLRAAAGAVLAYLKLNQLREAADTIVLAFTRNPHVPNILPIEEVVLALKEPKTWPNSLSVPLVFELHVSCCDGDSLTHLRYAFERFQEVNKIKVPGDLIAGVEAFGKAQTIEYLKRVWRPEVMRQTILYQGTKEIEEARIKVCQALAEYDPACATSYLDEIKERVKQLEIAKGTTLIEQSKVYVDIEAIKRALRSRLADSYARYKSASIVREPDLVLQGLTKVLQDNLDTTKSSLPLILADLHAIDSDIGSEADIQFEALFSEVTNEFLRGAHGLNAYLSTRIRHGTLVNTLRKPVADERLVTSRVEGKATYVRNQYWKEYQNKDAENYRAWESILDALDEFSTAFDAVVEHIRDNLIQIKIVHELKEVGNSSEALFVYRSSNLERRYVQECDRAMANMDEFVSYCVDVLWEKTDQNLARVQQVLGAEIRDRLMQPFTQLTNRINECSQNVSGMNELSNAVARARTNTQNKIGLVISWFKRSEVYDRQDYSPEFPFNIALNMVKNTISSAAGWNVAPVRSNTSRCLIPGRTLDGMVYVFYVLLENAILRSGLNAEELQLDAEVAIVDGVFSARVANSVSPTNLMQTEYDKVDAVRESIRRNESSHHAQREGRSGLHKIWLTLNSPIYREPALDFFHEKSFFVVEIKFRLEASE